MRWKRLTHPGFRYAAHLLGGGAHRVHPRRPAIARRDPVLAGRQGSDRLLPAGRADAGGHPALPEDKDEPEGIIDTLLAALAPGSYLTASHLNPEQEPEGVAAGVRAYLAGGVTVQARDSSELAALAFRNLDLVPPGVVSVSEWRPESVEPRPTLAEVSCYGGVGYKP